MNTEAKETAGKDDGLPEELRARVPAWMKDAVQALATDRVLRDADILREAVQEYLERRKVRKPTAAEPAQTEVAA